MEGVGYLQLCELMKSSKTDKLSFLKEIIPLTFVIGEIPEHHEPVYAKSLLYISCWLLMPSSDLSTLPPEYKQINSLLTTDTSELLPLFFTTFESSYNELSDIICNDTLVSLCLTINSYNLRILEKLKAEHCIAPLLWLLTYSPTHLKLASTLLPIAISKPNGIQELIKAFSRGDNSFKLKNLLIKVLKLTPANNKSQYLYSVIPQMIEIMTQFKCDLIVENVMEEVLNHFIRRNPEILMQVIEENERKLSPEQVVRFYRIMAQYVPPSEVVLCGISKKFGFFIQMACFLAGKQLSLKNELLGVLLQFFGFWQQAAEELINYAECPTFEFSFEINVEGAVVYGDKQADLNEIEVFDRITEILQFFADSHASSTVLASVFTQLITRFKCGCKFAVLYLINYMLANFEPVFLVNLPSQLQEFLLKTLESDDEKMVAISLQVLACYEPEKFDKILFVKASNEIFRLKSSQNQEIAEMAGKLNEKVSKALLMEEVGKVNEEVFEDFKNLESEEVHLCAIALHKLSISLPKLKTIPWDRMYRVINKDLFVFTHLQSCYKIALEVTGFSGYEIFLSQYSRSDDEIKSRLLEILFITIKSSKSTSIPFTTLVPFLNNITLGDSSDIVKDGAMVIISKLISKLSLSFHPYLNNTLHSILSTISLANSRLASSQPIPKLTASSLLSLQKILKNCHFSHYSQYFTQIRSTVRIFDLYYAESSSNIAIILKNLNFHIEELYLNTPE